ncbi:MAG: LemA family protein [Deltaproteobacteria bacterium]|jgi:hypothetical protein|nr:LemA family protein [Deltaproteobacteria bacterium]
MTGDPLAAQAIIAIIAASAAVAVLSYRKLAAERQRCLNSFARLGVLLKHLCARLEPLADPARARGGGQAAPGPDACALAEFQRARLAASTVLLGASHPTGRAVSEIARAFAELDAAAGRLPAPAGRAGEDLRECQARVARARAVFNGTAESYNRARRSFPLALFTRPFGFRKAYLYPVPEESGEREEPF